MKNTSLLIIVSAILLSCGGVKDAGKVLRNEKIKTTDEFLVEKKNPLVIPPNFEEIPKPGTLANEKTTDKDKIKKILKTPEKTNLSKNKSTSIEESILNRIRK